MAVDDVYTKSLLHLNGTDASTTITDESGKAWTAHGNAQLDTAQKKFGTASVLFDNNVITYIDTPYHPDFDIGNNDWTIDFWIRWNGSVGYDGLCEIGLYPSSIVLYHTGTTINITIGSTGFTLAWTPVADTWYHIAVTRENTSHTIKAFVNGTQIGATNTALTQHPTISSGIVLGAYSFGTAPFGGWIDEFRLSNTIRWTGNFTPPTAEYAAAVPTISAANISFSPSVYMEFIRGYVGDVAANITFSPVISGTMDYVPPPQISAPISFSPSMSGTMIYSCLGDVAIILPMFTLSATGIGENLGWAEPYLPMITLSAEGFDHPVGEGNLTLPMLSLLGIGQINELGEASLVLPMLRLLATGSADILGYGAITLPIFNLRSETVIGEIGEASLILPMYRISGKGMDGVVGEGAIIVPILTLSASGYPSIEGIANLILPMLTLFARNLAIASGTSGSSTTDFLNLVMNIRNNALTLYTNYAFNSLCRFNGKHLGATSTRIYDLDIGDQDDATEIDWNFRTGYLDLEQKATKKLRQAWLSYKSSGDLLLTIIQPDGDEYEYPLEGVSTTETGLRVKFGRGLASKYVALDIKNVDGSSITLDTLTLNLDKLSMRR